MKRQTWTKRDLAKAYPIGTPVAYCLGYPSSNINRQFGKVAGYVGGYYKGTFAIRYSNSRGEEFISVPVIPGRTQRTGWIGIVSEERLQQLSDALDSWGQR